MAFVAGELPPLVAYKPQIGRRSFRWKMLNFAADLNADGVGGRFRRFSPLIGARRTVDGPDDVDGGRTVLMKPLMFFMRSLKRLMAAKMFLTAPREILMFLMAGPEGKTLLLIFSPGVKAETFRSAKSGLPRG